MVPEKVDLKIAQYRDTNTNQQENPRKKNNRFSRNLLTTFTKLVGGLLQKGSDRLLACHEPYYHDGSEYRDSIYNFNAGSSDHVHGTKNNKSVVTTGDGGKQWP